MVIKQISSERKKKWDQLVKSHNEAPLRSNHVIAVTS